MLQRFGIVIAMAGLIPACFARGESKTAQRHLGDILIMAPTLVQHVGGTLALAFPAALKQGLKLAAADLMGVFPHSPAASTTKAAAQASMNANTATRHALVLLEAIDMIYPSN
jgi:hypothetical protein